MTQLGSKKQEILKRITGVGEERSHILKALRSCQVGADTVSHKIFQVYPDATDRFRRLENCHLEAVSRWVFTSLLDVCGKHEADATARLYSQFSGMPWVRSLWGLLFERLVLNFLDGIHKECNLPMLGLTNPGKMRWTYRGPIVRSTFGEATAVDKTRSAV